MPREKKVFVFNGVELSLYAPDDLSKKWYLEWYDGTKRRKNYKKINRADTVAGRLQLAEQRAKELSLELAGLKSADARLLDTYVQEIKGAYSKSTWRNIKSILSIFSEWLGNRSISRTNVELFFKHIRRTRHATTYNQYKLWVNTALDELDMRGMMVNIKNLKTTKTPQRYFQPHQRKKLRDAIKEDHPELWLAIKFAYYCFVRPAREMARLKAGHVLLEDQDLEFWGTHGKNKKSQRVAIPDTFIKDLHFIYDLRPGDYIFSNGKGKPRGRNTFNYWHQQFLDKLGFGPGYSIVSWRHTGAAEYIKSGGSIYKLKIQMRHYSVAQTDAYLRQLGIRDIGNLRKGFPSIEA